MSPGCEEIRDLLALWVDGELDAAERDAVAAHLATCAGCARAEKAERAAWRALDDLPGTIVPAGFAARVARASRPRPWWARPIPLAAAASVAAVLVLGSSLLRGDRAATVRGAAGDEEVIANLDLLEAWNLLRDDETAIALEAPEEDLLPLSGGG